MDSLNTYHGSVNFESVNPGIDIKKPPPPNKKTHLEDILTQYFCLRPH